MDNKDFHDICVECKLDFKEVSYVLFEKIKETESRTCDNCRHMKTLGHFYVCYEMYHHDIFTTTKDFGCNKFERKQDETNQ